MTTKSFRVATNHLDRIRLIALRFGSQGELALELGISRPTVNNFLTGKPVSIGIFKEICNKLNENWEVVAAKQVIEIDYEPKLENLVKADYDQFLWMEINHSKASIDLEEVENTDSEFLVLSRVLDYYNLSANTGKGSAIYRVKEFSGTNNYKVTFSDKDPLLLRIHKRIKDEMTLTVLQSIQKKVYESEVFKDSPLRDCLIPLKTSSNKNFVLLDNGYLAEAYPFAQMRFSSSTEQVNHYSARSQEQLYKFARRYGSLQKFISTQKIENIHFITEQRPGISWFGNRLAKIYEIFEKISEIADYSNTGIKISQKDQDFLKSVWNQVNTCTCNRILQDELFLHDCHPHNTFFYEDECLLIYDYETVSNFWSQSEALAFTMHRFIREHVRKYYARSENIRTRIAALVDIFLKGYSENGARIPENFRDSLSLCIKTTNLAKLLEVIAFYHRIDSDPANRNLEVLYSEFLKFLAFLKEADYF